MAAWGTTTSAPAGKLGTLFGVAAASSSDVLAVGGFNPGQTPTALLTQPYAEHWNGSVWSATSVPLGSLYPSGQKTAQLNGVADVAPGNGWAVGTVADPSLLASQTMAYHWNGAGSTDQSGHFAVGGLPDGSYTVIASLPGCQLGVATAQINAGIATSVNAPISCPP